MCQVFHGTDPIYVPELSGKMGERDTEFLAHLGEGAVGGEIPLQPLMAPHGTVFRGHRLFFHFAEQAAQKLIEERSGLIALIRFSHADGLDLF